MKSLVFTFALLTVSASVSSTSVAQERSDSAAAPRLSQDSTTRGRTDSASGYGESAPRPIADTTPPRAPDTVASAPARPPSDSSLVAACQSGPAGGMASHVLLVTFAADAGKADRSKAAATVGGKLAGEAPTGDVYVVVPDSVSIRDAADQMIQAPGVT